MHPTTGGVALSEGEGGKERERERDRKREGRERVSGT